MKHTTYILERVGWTKWQWSDRALLPLGGVSMTNLNFENSHLIQPAWRFMDLTPHVQYLSGLIAHVIEKEMHQESQYLRQHDQARLAIKDIT